MRVSLQCLGCKVNQAEIADLEQALISGGHEIVELSAQPDLCVVNTCTVTSKSDYQSRQLIRKSARTGARVIVTGCYSDMNTKSVSGMDRVEHVAANQDKSLIINYIDRNIKVSDEMSGRGSRTRYFLKVQDGCDHCCTYCIVWKARGKSRSIALEESVEMAKRATGQGYNEIVLTGVHLGLYGQDLSPALTLSDLIEGLLSKSEIRRIRVSSLEINEVTSDLLDIFMDSRVCPHLHIPLQSGDSDVLASMNRKYDKEHYRQRVLEIVSRTGEIALGTDIIAGFPTEPEGAFENSLSLASELPFTYMHVFPYSSRPGTAAGGFEDIVGHPRRKERAALLRDLAAWKKQVYLRNNIGRDLNVLFEQKGIDGLWSGTSENYLKVKVRSKEDLNGALRNVRISRVENGNLIGGFNVAL